MNYEPNTTQWRKGDIVIHDADAKEPQMLMRVVGYTHDGLCKTQYTNNNRRRKIWQNDIKHLHDPEKFELKPSWGDYSQKDQRGAQCAWLRVRQWKVKYPNPNIPIEVVVLNHPDRITTHTIGWPYLDKVGDDYIRVQGVDEDVVFAAVVSAFVLDNWHVYWDGKSQVWTGKKSAIKDGAK